MAEDPRLQGKPKTNDGTLPVMIYDYREMPETTLNIWHAQMAGWPTILTYDARAVLEMGVLESSSARKKRIARKRHDNLEDVDAGPMGRFRLPTSSSVWRDEYPFASTVENSGSTWVGHCDADEQRKQAQLIKSFYARHGALTASIANGQPFWFEVRVVNLPQRKLPRVYSSWPLEG